MYDGFWVLCGCFYHDLPNYPSASDLFLGVYQNSVEVKQLNEALQETKKRECDLTAQTVKLFTDVVERYVLSPSR